MEKPYRFRKNLLKSGGSNYVLVPASSKLSKAEKVIIEVYKDKIVILPAE